ncbi:MAG: hypothetical protein KGS44_09935 [Alphaproteobacteria bacterium]|nr:hypothetical protein [Alphaproteobacteria bacterium]
MAALRDGMAIARGPEDFVGVEVSGNAALFHGDFKIVRNIAPVGDGQWRLYDLSRDPGEVNDLAQQEPQRLADMIKAYEVYAAENGVLPLPPGYQVERQVLLNGIKRQLEYNAGWFALLAGAGLGFAFFRLRRASKARKGPTPQAQ